MQITADTFIVGRTRTYARSDIRRIVRGQSGNGVQLIALDCTDGTMPHYAYPDAATADDDAERIVDGSTTVLLRGESSRAAFDRIGAVLKATGSIPDATVIWHGRHDTPTKR